MKILTLQKTSLVVLLSIGLAVRAFAAEQAVTTDIGTLDQGTAEKVFPAKPPYSPYAGRNFPTRPFFGDTHLHTSFSMDAGAFGARLGGAAVLVDARVLASQSHIPAGNLTLVNRQSTYSHNDPAGAYPTNAFFAELVPFLRRISG